MDREQIDAALVWFDEYNPEIDGLWAWKSRVDTLAAAVRELRDECNILVRELGNTRRFAGQQSQDIDDLRADLARARAVLDNARPDPDRYTGSNKWMVIEVDPAAWQAWQEAQR